MFSVAILRPLRQLPLRSLSLFPGHVKKFSARATSSQPLERMPVERFLGAMSQFVNTNEFSTIPRFLQNRQSLKSVLQQVNGEVANNYLYEHFVYWLSRYAAHSTSQMKDYFAGKCSLEDMCKNFIEFCFSQKIMMDEEKTLKSFDYHNQLSDRAVKQELSKIQPKAELNLLGFGCDEGAYEKYLAQHLIATGIAKSVKLFGFDPYAKKSANIHYLSSEQLTSNQMPKLDVITARWSLHHVALQNRWHDFVNCINQCHPDALVLAVEHGFLKTQPSLMNEKLYNLINATFDVVANIGLRPRYTGANFFIRYLKREDWSDIQSKTSLKTTSYAYDVGPGFPNQTILALRAKHSI